MFVHTLPMTSATVLVLLGFLREVRALSLSGRLPLWLIWWRWYLGPTMAQTFCLGHCSKDVFINRMLLFVVRPQPKLLPRTLPTGCRWYNLFGRTYPSPFASPPLSTRPFQTAFCTGRLIIVSTDNGISFIALVISTAHVSMSHSRTASRRTLQQSSRQTNSVFNWPREVLHCNND